MQVHVRRDAAGRIVAASAEPLGEGWEPIAAGAPELAAFTAGLASPSDGLEASDLGLVRVLEDVIDLLVERGVIRYTDLPQAAQDKLNARRSARATRRGLELLDEDGGVI